MFSFISPQASIPAPAAKKVIPFLAYFPKMKVGLSNHESVCVSPTNNCLVDFHEIWYGSFNHFKIT
jgi:hypothetical protein